MTDWKKYILLFPALFGVVITLLPLSESQQWWVRMWDFPRLQISVWCVAFALVIGLFFRPLNRYVYLLIISLVGCSIFQATAILPYTPIYPVEVQLSSEPESQDRISVLTANVLTDNRDASALLEVVKKESPDLILLTEPDAWWLDAVKGLKETYPYIIEHPLDNTYGMALFSRLPPRPP